MTATKYPTDEQKSNQASTKTATPDPVSQCIGEYGRCQLIFTFLLSLLNLPCTFHIFAPTFEAAPSDFWCRPPSSLAHLDLHQWKQLSGTTFMSPVGKEEYNPCLIKDLNYTLPYDELIKIETNETRECTSWDYNTSEFGETIIYEWDLVCKNEQLGNVAEMMFLLGVAAGGLVSGLLSDKFGRKKTLMASLITQTVLGTLIAFAPSYIYYAVLRMFLGFFSVSIVFSGFVLCMELVGGKWLTISGVSFLFPVPVGYIVVSLIAYFVKGWRLFQLALTLPSMIFLSLWWILPESPRWLLTMGKHEQAVNVIQRIAKLNKRDLPPNLDKILNQNSSGDELPNVSILSLFRTPKIRKISLILFVVWYTTYLLYFGLTLNMSNLGGNVYINSMIAGAVEIPAIGLSILMLLQIGRKWPLSLSIIFSGIACLLTIPTPLEYEWVKIGFAMIGKFCISSSNVIMTVYTAELFPTVVRNLGLGSSNLPAGGALLLVPYLWNMAQMDLNLPMAVLGTVGVVGGSCVLLLPETGGGRPLPATIEELEAS